MGKREVFATVETKCRAIGLTAGPQYPPCEDFPPTTGRGEKVARSTPISELMVLIRLTASAPPRSAAAAICATLVTLGVSFTITGIRAASFTHAVIISVYSGT